MSCGRLAALEPRTRTSNDPSEAEPPLENTTRQSDLSGLFYARQAQTHYFFAVARSLNAGAPLKLVTTNNPRGIRSNEPEV